MDPLSLRTERLVLRPWRSEDRAPFAAMNADPLVMRHFPGVLAPAQSDALVEVIEDHFGRLGFGLWAVEVVGVAPFIGFVGLAPVTFAVPFDERFEVSWRLASAHWGCGYATEAATEVLRAAFGPLGLAGVVSFTIPANRPSTAVMERIGLHRRPQWDFDHPRLAPGHPMRHHVVYGRRADGS